MNRHILWADAPVTIPPEDKGNVRRSAQIWSEHVYPLGNGRLGVTVFGGPGTERIHFNEESLWVGNEDNTGAYQPFGDVHVQMDHTQVTDYRRELDIRRAVHIVSYVCNGVCFKRETFVSAPAGVMVARFTAGSPKALSGRVSIDNLHRLPCGAEGDELVFKGKTDDLHYWKNVLLKEPDRLLASREYASDQCITLDFEARIRILTEGGSLTTGEDAVHFKDCDTVTLLLAAGTNYVNDRNQGWRSSGPVSERIRAQLDTAASSSYDKLLNEHLTDYQSIYNRLELELASTPEELTAQPTAKRLAAYRQQFQSSHSPVDHGLEVLLYNYARYLMISSSRPGANALPTNLQGIWLYRRHPAWRCDFHTDINIQMNYWFTYASNLCECFEPFAQWIDSIREVRSEETRRVLGVKRGWLMRSENGIFGGSTWHIQKGDSAWLCQNLWDYFTFTQDRAYLERYAYPVMKEISEFWIDHLEERPDPKHPERMVLVAPKGRSPEHGPTNIDGVTYDQVLCWDLFNNTIEASQTLDKDADFRSKLTAKRDQLLGLQIGRWGQLQEWMDDIDDPDDDHRHINHMICVHPGRQVHPSTTPKLAEAARISVEARRDHGQNHPGWSRVWKACIFARLLDGESAYEQLSETLATHVYGNLWAVHPPFQIDCNFGYAAGVNEMLVQSHHASRITHHSSPLIHLLPSLPTAWPTGSVRGLRVRGGFELDIAWQDGTLTDATLRGISNPTPDITVRYGKHEKAVSVASGKSRHIEF